jgi:hypothetical protein
MKTDCCGMCAVTTDQRMQGMSRPIGERGRPQPLRRDTVLVHLPPFAIAPCA